MEDHPNKDICAILVRVGEHERDISGQIYKFVAYNKASKALSSLDHRVQSGAEAQKLPGIGPKIGSVIQKIVSKRYDELPVDVSDIIPGASSSQSGSPSKSGEKRKLKSDDKKKNKKDKKKSKNKKKKRKHDSDSESSESETSSESSESETDDDSTANDKKPVSQKSIDSQKSDNKIESYANQMMLSNIDVQHLIAVHGLHTLSDLEKRQELLTENQSLCIKNYKDLIQPIPAEEGEKYLAQIEKVFEDDDDLNFYLCGDFRRDCKQSSTIDILITNSKMNSSDEDYEIIAKKKFKTIIKSLEEEGIILSRLDHKKDHCFALAKIKKSNTVRTLRLYWASKDQFVCRMFFLTGPRNFVGEIQDKAREKDFILDQYSLRKCGKTLVPGEQIPLKSEQGLFDYIDLDYVKPERRK